MSSGWPRSANLVLDLAENLTDLVFKRIGAGGALPETMQIRKQLEINEISQVIAFQGFFVVEPAIGAFGRSPLFPAVRLVENIAVWFAGQRRFGGFILLKAVEVFQKQQPRGLFGVIEFSGAAGLFPEGVIDVFEGLFEHLLLLPFRIYGVTGVICQFL